MRLLKQQSEGYRFQFINRQLHTTNHLIIFFTPNLEIKQRGQHFTCACCHVFRTNIFTWRALHSSQTPSWSLTIGLQIKGRQKINSSLTTAQLINKWSRDLPLHVHIQHHSTGAIFFYRCLQFAQEGYKIIVFCCWTILETCFCLWILQPMLVSFPIAWTVFKGHFQVLIPFKLGPGRDGLHMVLN